MGTTSENNMATFIHLSTLSQYFIPFGNYIFPILIWNSKKDDSEFIDYNGKQVLNFQLSILLYSLVLAMIAIPILIFTIFSTISFYSIKNEHDFILNHLNIESISGTVVVALIAILSFIGLKVGEFFLIIYAAVKTSNGEKYNYPLTINFIK